MEASAGTVGIRRLLKKGEYNLRVNDVELAESLSTFGKDR